MTAKNTKAKPARRTKATGSKGPAKGKLIEIALPESGTAEEAQETLAGSVPGWNEMTKEQQAELAEIAVTQRKQRQPVKVTLIPPEKLGAVTVGDVECLRWQKST